MSGEFINKEFIQALKELEKERGISMDVIIDAMEAALIAAYKKNFGSSQNVRVEINKETGEVHVYFRKTVTETVEDERTEMTLAEAQKLDPDFELGDVMESEVTPRSFGRIAAQTAKQVVVQRIREAERNVIYDTYINREGEMLSGQVDRVESRNVLINLGKTEALLAPAEQIPKETYSPGERFKLYVSEVRKTNKGAQVLVSRTHTGLLRRLLEMEVPEIYDGTVEIKAVVREAGQRSKVAVFSKNENVDCVGACVGSRGMRIQAVVNELNGEKIEVIKWSPDPVEFITNAMSPAKVVRVEIDEENKFAQVIVPDFQLSLAIGKEGQNARLAVRLTNWKIDIKSESQMEEMQAQAAQLAATSPIAAEMVLSDDSAVAEAGGAESVTPAEAADETTAADAVDATEMAADAVDTAEMAADAEVQAAVKTE